jgi:Protein of unknown function (DUF1397)
MNNFTASIDHCLEAEEKTSRDMFVNIFTNLLNFVCHKDGDQIARESKKVQNVPNPFSKTFLPQSSSPKRGPSVSKRRPTPSRTAPTQHSRSTCRAKDPPSPICPNLCSAPRNAKTWTNSRCALSMSWNSAKSRHPPIWSTPCLSLSAPKHRARIRPTKRSLASRVTQIRQTINKFPHLSFWERW